METSFAPHLTHEQVITIAKDALQKAGWQYDEEYGLQPLWRGTVTDAIGRQNEETILWSVNFLTPQSIFDQESRFLDIDDETGKPLGIITKHDYFVF